MISLFSFFCVVFPAGAFGFLAYCYPIWSCCLECICNNSSNDDDDGDSNSRYDTVVTMILGAVPPECGESAIKMIRL